MKRAVFIALGAGLVLTSAAALDSAGTISEPGALGPHDATIHVAQARAAARAAQREAVDARHRADRERCASLGGRQRDACLIRSHAARGRALLEIAAPYADRG